MSTESAPESTSVSENKARAAGRGGIAVLGAKAFFIVSGLAQQTLLPRMIGLAGFGALSRVLGVANIVNNVIVASSVQGVSRAVAGAREHDEEALRATLRVHVPLALVVGLVFALASPLVATYLMHAPYVTVPLVAMVGVVISYGAYAPLIGAINGRGQFSRQATLDVTFAVLRTTGLLGGGYLFVTRGHSGALGATLGFVVAAVCIVPLALRWTGIGRPPAPGLSTVPRPAAYLNGLWPLAVAQLFTNTLMQIDLTLLGRFLADSATSAGIARAADAADEWVGVYRACQIFAFLPYQLLFSITQVLFPMLARAKADGDQEAVRAYVARGARLGAIACGLMVAVIVAMPGSLINFAYGPDVAARGERALRILAIGQGAFAMFGIGTTVLASLGRERVAALISFLALVMVGASCWVFVPGRAFGEAQLVATAIATCAALVCGLAATAITVRTIAGAFVPAATVARVGLGVALAALAGSHVPHVGRIVAPFVAAAIGIGYLGILFVTRELGAVDAQAIRALAGRRAAKG